MKRYKDNVYLEDLVRLYTLLFLIGAFMQSLTHFSALLTLNVA